MEESLVAKAVVGHGSLLDIPPGLAQWEAFPLAVICQTGPGGFIPAQLQSTVSDWENSRFWQKKYGGILSHLSVTSQETPVLQVHLYRQGAGA